MLSFSFAVLIDKFKADLPSSGFGNVTVGNSGSGWICSITGINGTRLNDLNDCLNVK